MAWKHNATGAKGATPKVHVPKPTLMKAPKASKLPTSKPKQTMHPAKVQNPRTAPKHMPQAKAHGVHRRMHIPVKIK